MRFDFRKHGYIVATSRLRKVVLLLDVAFIILCFLKCSTNFEVILTVHRPLICGNKMPTRSNRYFYCRSYCLLNMIQASLRPSSGAREYYTVGCCLWSLALGCSSPQTRHTTLSSTPYRQLENQAPNTTGSNHLYNTLELLMMGVMVPETC